MSPARSRTAPVLIAVLLGAASGEARASVTAQAQPGYSQTSGSSRDETGAETGFDATQWVQRYRLGIDQRLYPSLTFSAGGNLVWTNGTSEPTGSPSTESESQQWNAFGRLGFGSPDLGGGFDYTRVWSDAATRSAGVTTEAPGSVRETLGASGVWRPADLPELTLRLGRSRAYDDAREFADVTTDEAHLSSRYEPVPNLLLVYSLRYGRATDNRTEVGRSEISNAGEVTWNTRFLEDRGNLYLSYRLAARTSNTSAPNPTAEVATQQTPEQGLSKIEDFSRGETPQAVVLGTNNALVDGNALMSAGVNLGTDAGAGLLVAPRDLGARFRDVITPVDEIHVYVDKELPPELADDFTWTVYQSSDNVTWSPVVSGTVAFNPVLLRFEVPITRTQARHLKVVTTPLRPSPTIEAQYQEIFVTELQFFQLTPAALVRGRDSDVSGNLTGTTRVLLVRDLGLAYDFSGFIAHGRGAATWSVLNGLSAARRLDPVFAVAARVERSDADAGAGWQAQNRWSASLSADPLPTLGALVSYSGSLAQTDQGTAISNSGTLTGRADLYDGLALNGLASASWSRNEQDITSRTMLTSASASIVPNRYVSLGGSVAYSEAHQSGGGQESQSKQQGSVEASASITPFPALALSGNIARQFGATTATLAGFNGAFSPFRGGDLQLRYIYQESLDIGADRRTRVHGPGARWNIRPGWYADVSWSSQSSRSPVTVDRTRTLNANLLITFR